MEKTAPTFTKTEDGKSTISVGNLERYAKDWICDSEYRQHSGRTLESRRFLVEKLIWFMHQREYSDCGASELRQFLTYVTNGHKEPGGRWGNPRMTKAVRPVTVKDYHAVLRTMFAWMVEEELLAVSPMSKVPPPTVRENQVQPFTQDQVQALLNAARRSQHRRRNEVIVLFMLDTGVRASELCELKMGSLDPAGRRCTVVGKGNKTRAIFFGRQTAKALSQYLRDQSWEENQPVFSAGRGLRAGEPLTRSGLLQLIRRLGRAAGIQATRCSPHTFRHTFAVEFLRNGGNIFSLQQMLGHTSLHMTNRYVALAQADIENQHRQFSPADRLRQRSK